MNPQKRGIARSINLPPTLKSIFWDYEFTRLRWEKDRDLVIGRILSHGDWKALKWLRTRLEDQGLRQWLLNRQGAGLTSRQLRFWEMILRLPHPIVNQWLKSKGRTVWERRAL